MVCSMELWLRPIMANLIKVKVSEKTFGLYINNAFLKDTMVIIATVSEITHTTDKKH